MTLSDITISEHYAPNGDGWLLHLRRTVSPSRLREGSRPVVIVPGYGMNSFIFGFHPRGTSMERWLAEAGLEVWSANLRRQGDSRPQGSRPTPPSLRAYAETDVPAVVDAVLASSTTGADRVDLIGCSLGGSIVYAHLALVPDHRVAAVVAIGAPLRWTEVHPILRVAFSSPGLVGRIPLAGTRRLARAALPLLARAPFILSIYMNTEQVDLTYAKELTRTVDDPHPRVNRDIAMWIKARDMVLGGVNVTEALAGVDIPLLVVAANRDGIVPLPTTLSVVDAWGGDAEVLNVGDDDVWYAHADLFVGDKAPEHVFTPIAKWLHAAREAEEPEAAVG